MYLDNESCETIAIQLKGFEERPLCQNMEIINVVIKFAWQTLNLKKPTLFESYNYFLFTLNDVIVA
jgi:hypothetical protein